MKSLLAKFRKKTAPAPVQAAPETSIYWAHWEFDSSGHFWMRVHGSKASPEYTFDNEEQMRKMYDGMIQKYRLISLAPDFAANPHKTDALSCSKEKITVIFSDGSELSSAEHFKGAHEQLQKLKIKQLIAAAGLAPKDWITAFDAYQFVMIRRDIIQSLQLQDAFVIFQLVNGRKPYTTAWEDIAEAKQKYSELQAQLGRT